MRSEDRGPGIRIPQGQLLLSMLCFVGTDVSQDTGWDRDPRRGPIIDVSFNLGGGHCQTRRQRLPGGMPSMSSSTSVVDAIDPSAAPPRWSAIDIFFNLGGGRCWTRR
jgi:hypothetical protein